MHKNQQMTPMLDRPTTQFNGDVCNRPDLAATNWQKRVS